MKSPTGAAPNGLHQHKPGYTMPAAGVRGECKNRLIERSGGFFAPFSNLPGWISIRKITPLIFQRSTKFTGTAAAIFLE